jgi:FHA domain-containing protein
MARLIYKNGPRPGEAIELRPGLNRIGRNPANDIVVPDPSVSSAHCEMHVSDLGIAFRDLGSTNGSFIDGRRVTKEILTSGKVLRLGSVDFAVELPVANVAIPELPKEEEVFANFLPDGTQACQKHADVPAAWRCGKCEKAWCDQCVRRTGMVGSANQVVSCLECGGKCEKTAAMVAEKKKGFFEAIGATIRLKRPK